MGIVLEQPLTVPLLEPVVNAQTAQIALAQHFLIVLLAIPAQLVPAFLESVVQDTPQLSLIAPLQGLITELVSGVLKIHIVRPRPLFARIAIHVFNVPRILNVQELLLFAQDQIHAQFAQIPQFAVLYIHPVILIVQQQVVTQELVLDVPRILIVQGRRLTVRALIHVLHVLAILIVMPWPLTVRL